ncbi:PAP2 superfamily-domain-containing protein [Phlyctochytrium arcticum]|nr:PAP2 superfamily-domain-containing protein [Phlyctochytrium arcticum]
MRTNPLASAGLTAPAANKELAHFATRTTSKRTTYSHEETELPPLNQSSLPAKAATGQKSNGPADSPPPRAGGAPPPVAASPSHLKYKIRAILLPYITAESRQIAYFQSLYITPFIARSCMYLGALGTHTAFLLLLPMLFWFDSGVTIPVAGQQVDVNRVFGRSLVVLLGAGVYVSGCVKDWLGLPRPLTPPVRRVSGSAMIEAEYGFPSTHSTNAVSLSLFTALFALRYWLFQSDLWIQVLSVGVLACYAVAIGASRVVTGMHTVIDVLGGALIGIGLVLGHWWVGMDAMETQIMTAGWALLINIPALCIILISIHPDPDGPCPCFDDSVAFVGTIGGLLMGNWHHAILSNTPSSSTAGYSAELGPIMALQRIFCGIGIILAWRLTIKRLCHAVLPPLYRLLALPFRRKFFALATKDYQTIPASHMGGFAPSLLHWPHAHPQNAHRYRLSRYDVDIGTKLIVYCGIGWWASEGVPVLFSLLGI